MYFQSLDDKRAIRLNLDSFGDICEANEFYPTVLLVATGERSVMHKQLQEGEGQDAVEKGVKSY